MGYRRLVDAGVFIFSAFCTLGGSSAAAAPVCQPGTLSSYLAPGFACTEGGGLFTFTTFAFQGAAGGLNADQISLVPIDVPTEVGFMFSGNFTANPGQTFSYMFSYFIDPPPPIIRGDQVDLDPTGAVSLQVALCSTAFPCLPANQEGTLNVSTQKPTASISLPNLSTLGVQATLVLDGGSGVAQSNGFDNITLLTPEPAGFALAGCGLLALLAVRSRAKVRQILFQLFS